MVAVMLPAARSTRALLAGLGAVALALAPLACSAPQGERSPEGERKKQWSGRSYAAQTRVQSAPVASLASEGFDEERVWGGGDDWEPAVAVDPGAPWVYQLTTRYGGSQPQIIFRASADGGATWGADQLLANNAADPMIEVADDGTIFAMGIVGNGFKLQLTRSRDHGASWTPPQNVLTPGQPNWGDRPVLAISPDGTDVYVAFNQSDPYVSSSHDGADGFLAPVQTSSNGRYWFHSAGAVAPNGDVYFAAADYSQDFTGASNLYVIHSSDDGASWSTTLLDTSAEAADCAWADGCYFGFLGPSAGLAIDVNGLVLIAYNRGDTAGAAQQLWVRSSTNGVDWSPAQAISDPTQGVHNGFPAVGAWRTNAGDFRVVWQDDRAQSETGWNTWIRRSLDGGGDWSDAERLSDLDSGAPYKSATVYAFVYGDYLELAVDGQDVNHAIWGEGDSYTGPGGSWYTRGVALPEPSGALPLLAGLGLLRGLRGRRARRRVGGVSPRR
jgi:hypothetical protein